MRRNLIRPFYWSVFAFSVGVVVTLIVWWLTADIVARQEKGLFEFRAQEKISAIINAVDNQKQLLFGGAGFVNASDEITRDQWRTYVETLIKEMQLSGAQGLGFALRLAPEELTEHVRQVRAEGFPDYSIRPEGERTEYTSIIYLEPFNERNKKAFGYDMFSEPVRRKAMEQARDTGQVVMSGKVILVQENDSDVQAGFLIYMPVYRKGQPIITVDERRAALYAYVYSPFRARNFVDKILPSGFTYMRLQIFDGPEANEQSLLFDSHGRDVDVLTEPTKTTVVEITTGHEWTIRLSATAAFTFQTDRSLPWILLGVGILLSLALGLIIWFQQNSYAKARQLLESRKRFKLLFEQAMDSVLILEIPPDGLPVIVDVNHATISSFGYEREDLIGKPISILDPDSNDPELILERGETIRAKGAAIFEAKHRCKDGREVEVECSVKEFSDGERRFAISIERDIGERKRTEEVIKHQRDMAKTYLDIAGVMFIALNDKGDVTLANNRAAEILQTEIRAIEGKNWFETFIPIRQREFVFNTYDSVMNGTAESGKDYENEVVTGSGEHRLISWHNTALKDSEGKIIGILGSGEDITERRRSEGKIEQLNLVLSAIRNIGQLIIRQTDTEKLIRDVCAFLVASRGYTDAFIILLDETGKPYTYAESGLTDTFPPLAEQLRQGILPHCLANTSLSDQMVFVADAPAGCVSCPISTHHGANSDTLCCRLSNENRTLGFLVISTKRSNTIFDTEERAILADMVRDLALALHNIENKKIAVEKEARLRESELRYRRLFESAKDGILILDAETGMIIDVNPFLIKLLRFSKEEFLGKAVWELGIFGDLIANHNNFLELQKNKYIRYEDLPLETRGGKNIHVEFVSNVYQMGEQTVIQCNIRDITEHKHAEAALKESEQRHRDYITNAPYGVFVANEKGRYIQVNPAACRISGYAEAELLSMSIPDILFEDGLEEGMRSLQGVKQDGRSLLELPFRTKSGERRLWSVSAVKLSDTRFLGFCQDITNSKAAEAEIREMNNQLAVKNRIAEICLSTPDKDMYADVLDVVLEELESPFGLFGYLDHKGDLVCPSLTRNVWEQWRIPEKEIVFAREVWAGIWGKSLIEGRTQISNERCKTPEGHIPIERVIATPVIQQGNVIGLMMIANRTKDYTDRDIRLLETITEHLSPIIQARLSTAREEYQRIMAENRLRDHMADLENKVAERTQKLNDTLHAVEQSRDQIDGILKSVADGLIVTDASNRIIQMNRIAEDALGIRFCDVRNTQVHLTIEDPSLREKFAHTLDKQITGYEFDFRVKDPETSAVRIMRGRTSVVLDREGAIFGVVTLIQDVTDEREMDRMKTEFISTATHELRTPLTSILGFSEILLTRTAITPKDKKKYLTYINTQAHGLTGIVNDLLDISRIESGKGFTLEKAETLVGDIIHPLIPMFQGLTTKHTFEVDLKDDKVKLLVDRNKMEQVIRNLLSNAVKYSPKGGMIRIGGYKRETNYEISIEDQGIGMTRDQVNRVFEKFYRADATSTAIEGTGLGMSIVKYILEAHGGTVNVQSEFGKGTTVKITIPLERKTAGLQGKVETS